VAFFLIFRYFSHRIGVLAGTNDTLAVKHPFWDDEGQGLE
jgi:hypothetical protein